MQSLNYYQLFQELLSHNSDKEIVIEIGTFNKFARKIKSCNIICDFDYSDLENYAHSVPDQANIEHSKLTFRPSTTWIKDIRHISRYYKKPEKHTDIVTVWEEASK